MSGVFAKSQHSRKFDPRSCLERTPWVQKRSALMVSVSSVVDQMPANQRPLSIYLEGRKTRSEWTTLLDGAELSSAVWIQFIYLLHLLTGNAVFEQHIVLAGELKTMIGETPQRAE